jgi:hypothetical protein
MGGRRPNKHSRKERYNCSNGLEEHGKHSKPSYYNRNFFIEHQGNNYSDNRSLIRKLTPKRSGGGV